MNVHYMCPVHLCSKFLEHISRNGITGPGNANPQLPLTLPNCSSTHYVRFPGSWHPCQRLTLSDILSIPMGLDGVLHTTETVQHTDEEQGPRLGLKS